MTKEFKNKKILITGGTGTFGKAFLKYLYSLKNNQPKKIVIYARDEHKFNDMINSNLIKKNTRLINRRRQR
jgi:UDP-N-acetylglucosamine 4,6-dehydratase